VLINERVRGRVAPGRFAAGRPKQTGYDRAWATILIRNITTLIAGLAFAGLWFRAGARVCCRARTGILTADVFSGVLSAGCEFLVRQQKEAEGGFDRHSLASGGRRRYKSKTE
jgi:hypothetical protein